MYFAHGLIAGVGGASSYDLIQETVVPNDATQIEFTNIPTNYNSYEVIATGQMTELSADELVMYLNNDKDEDNYRDGNAQIVTSTSGSVGALNFQNNIGIKVLDKPADSFPFGLHVNIRPVVSTSESIIYSWAKATNLTASSQKHQWGVFGFRDDSITRISFQITGTSTFGFSNSYFSLYGVTY